MSQIERYSSQSGELVVAGLRKKVPALIHEVSVDLTPWQRHKLRTEIARCRRDAVVEIVDIETKTLVAEAEGAAGAYLAACRERNALDLFGIRTDCLEAAGVRHEEAAMAIGRLPEDSRAIFGNALNAVSLRYTQGVERRARES
jgi:hypothetical protein